MSLGAERCVFGIDGKRKVLGVGCGAELVWAAWAQGPCQGTEELLPHHGQHVGRKADRRIPLTRWKRLMFLFLPGSCSLNTTSWSLWGHQSHAGDRPGGTECHGPNPVRHKDHEPGLAVSLSWHGAIAHGVAEQRTELHRQLWVTQLGKDGNGDVFSSKVLMWSGENKQNYRQEHKYMTWHLNVVLLLLPFFSPDTFFIP